MQQWLPRVLLAQLLSRAAGTGVIRVPVHGVRKSDGAAMAAAREGAAEFEATPGTSDGGSAPIHVPISGDRDVLMQFYGPVKIGGNTFNVIFDTGSANVWVPSSRCNVWNCWFHSRYDNTRSRTYEPDGRPYGVVYGSGMVGGFFSKDTITMGDVDVQGQLFAEVSRVSFAGGPLTFASAKFDGILGLGFKAISEYNISTPFEAMIDQGLIDESVFAFYLPRDASEEGELTLGGADRAHYTGELHDVPLVSDAYWEVGIDAMYFKQYEIVLPAVESIAIIDSGASLIVGPKFEVAALALIAGARRWGASYRIDCGKRPSLPDLVITLGGKNFTLGPSEYVVDTGKSSTDCMFGFMKHDALLDGGACGYTQNCWILGYVFMKKYYCAFDYGNKRMRMALAARRGTEVAKPNDKMSYFV